MPFSTPPSASNGNPIASSHVNTLRDNDLWFGGLLANPSQTGQVPIASSTSAAAYGFLGTASIVDGAFETAQIADGAVGALQTADGNVDLTALASAVVVKLIPAGFCVWVRTAAEIPAGWSRETNVDGRMLVGAGTTFTVTYVEATNYGSSWSHTHTIALSAAAISATGPNLDTISPEEAQAAHPSHGHATASGDATSTAWAIPSHAYVAIRKN